MAVRTIPQSYEYACDFCGETHLQTGASGHYTDSCPPGWLGISLHGSGAEQWHADHKAFQNRRILLCDQCGANALASLDQIDKTFGDRSLAGRL